MDFHTELIKITEFQPLEDYLVKKKARELSQTGKSGKITVSINPSNLIELARIGERFAIDSCIERKDFKYVSAENLIPNKYVPTHLSKVEEDYEGYERAPTRAAIQPIIPQLIVHERPGITYKPLKECNYSSFTQESSFAEPIPSESQKTIVQIPSADQVSKTMKKGKATEKRSPNLANSINKITIKPKTIKAKKQKTNKKVKTILRKQIRS